MTTLAPNPMMIRLADEFGNVLVGRSTAERIRLRIEESAHGSEPVVLDFEGIITVSPSFADELFAKLEPELRQSGQLELRSMSPALESIARFVVAGRA
jgi:anti-anti-sigma regulatory factor